MYMLKYYCLMQHNLLMNTVYVIQHNWYGRPESYTESDKIKVSMFSELTIDLAYVLIQYGVQLTKPTKPTLRKLIP